MEERIANSLGQTGVEPGLQEVLADPIVVSLMKATASPAGMLTASARVSRPPAHDEFSVAV